MRGVVRRLRVGMASRATGYDGSSASSSSSDSSESRSDSDFENENVVESTESSHVTGSSEFEEAEVLEEIEEESDFEAMDIFSDMEAIPQVSTPTFSDLFGNGNGEEEDLLISSSDVEIIEQPLTEIIDISSGSTVMVNVVDISSRGRQPLDTDAGVESSDCFDT
ncbi:hypothetical protein Bca4012_020172 [Brassica carinata]|uniref:Uncharacterized protein n=1 Tax=Brassica carinata TaxID=52824 RepID=A0A8X8BCQ0_BRACI|nr:hypothetical protein Bca52824_001415 [Brassica carinata]